MNKKFSTLVAMLLASGGLFYAVDAMVLPASEGVAKTFVTAAAQAEANGVITGYTLKAATFAEETCTWKLEQNGGKYLLVAGEGFYLNDKLEVQKGKDGISGFTVADGVISGLYIKADGSLTTTAEGNQPAGLFATTGAIATTTEGSYALGPVAYGQGPLESLTNESLGLKMVAAVDAKVQAAVFSTSETVSPAFTLEAGNGADSESLYLKLGEGAYLLSDGTEISIGAKPTEANVNSKITLEGGTFKVKIGEKWLANSGATLSLGNATANGTIYASTSDVVEGGTPTKAEDVAAGNTIALFTLGSSEIATTDYKVTFTPAVPAANTMVALTNVSGENFTNVDESMKFSLASKSLKLSGKFVTYDKKEGVVLSESTGNDFKLLSDGTLAYDLHVLSVSEAGAIVTTGGEPLYLYEATGKIAESTTSASTFVLSKKVLGKAPVTSLTNEKVATAIAKEIDPSKPGVDVPGMEDITVAEDGKITVSTDLTDIPAPHTISTGNGILSVKDGAVVYLSGEDAANATSWILKDGKYMSVEMAKLGKANAWLGNAPAQKAVQPTTYALVTKGAAIDAKATSAGVTLGNTPITATLTTTGTAVPVDVTLEEASWLNSVSNGAVVILGNGTSAFIKNAKGEVTDNIYQAALWVVNMSARADGSYNYSFKQKDTENYLTVGSAKDFVAEKYEGGFALKATGGYVTIPASGSASLDVNSVSSVLYGVPVSTKPFTAKEILTNHGTLTSFNLSLWDEKDGVSNLVQNPFEDADLVPVYYNSTDKTFTPITADNASRLNNPATFLLKKGDSYIVAETTKDSEWSNINAELVAGGFKFVTLSEKAMAEVMVNGTWKNGTYAPCFTFNYNKNAVENGVATANTPIYSIRVASYDNQMSVGNVSTFTIKSDAQAGTYLTTSSKSDYWVYAEFSANNAVRGDSDKDYNPLNMKYVNITFVNHSSITWNNIKLDGKVLGAEAKPADAANFLFSKPEGQWAVKMTAATGDLSKGKELGDDVYRFTFKNRESGETYDVNKLFYLGNNKYAVSYSNTYDKFAQNAGTLRDTIAITPVEGLKNNTRQFDGYKNMTAQEVQDQLFNLLVASAEEDYYVGENHTAKSHFLGLSHSEEAAVNWRIVPLTAARTYDANKDLTQASDSVYVFNNPQYYKASDKKFYQYNDTVAIISYALQNVANDEFLTYENPQTTDILSMICNPNFKSYKTTKNISDAHRFVLKEKGTDLYNIIAVDYPEYDTKGEFVAEGENAWASLNLNRKLYGATTLTKQGAVEVEGAYKQINSNDVFKVQMVGAPEYRLMNMGDTIRIFRQENEYDQMFEKGEFLNIGNKAQLTDMAPALYVDTAYVKRGHNNRYQYLLVVNPNYVPAEPCNIPGHPTVHPDTTYGRFLVNLIDTANVAYQNGAIHANKYINDTEAGEKFAKLGFVYGFRTADKLYITDKNFQKSGKASDVIDLSTRDFNVAKFAFRYINPINHESDGSFKIQTGYYHYNSYIATNKQPEVENNGYLKNINGVMVVAKGYEAGDKFDLAIEHSDPTANDAISANGVSVAAIDGAVIVKGAAGKTVVITNILGQTIANAVLSSDNETIAAPAGVVVVAVEGEAAVKAIVK